jgi:sugar/nucleoside kinase (ribokinase family)
LVATSVASRVPSLLIVGHVTCDEIAGDRRLGGAAAFAARVACLRGTPTALFTSAAVGSPGLDELCRTTNLSVQVQPAAHTTTFAITYAAGGRSLILRAQASRLEANDVSSQWKNLPVGYLGPVAGECDPDLPAQLGGTTFWGVGLQGFLRRFEERGRVLPVDAGELPLRLQGLRAPIRTVILSDEDHPDAATIASDLAGRDFVVALTHGPRGASVLVPGSGSPSVHHVPAHKAREIDPTGAGDAFGVVFTQELARGFDPVTAATRATEVAARVVEGPGTGRL